MKKILSFILSFTLFSTTAVPLTGCTSASTVNEINVVLTEATNILVVADPNAAWVPDLKAAVVALKTSEASWQAGGPIQDVDDALNTIIAVTAVIPQTEKYSPLIDVLVAGVEVILGALPVTSSAVTAHAITVNNPHLGMVTIPHKFAHSRTKEFIAAWNKAAVDNDLATATIQ